MKQLYAHLKEMSRITAGYFMGRERNEKDDSGHRARSNNLPEFKDQDLSSAGIPEMIPNCPNVFL
jgi:hypothetical protein